MADNDPGCPIQGKPDLYGLGVRLGLYLQFIAIVLARPSVKPTFKAIAGSTVAFVLANFIVLVKESASRTLFAPEAYLLFLLLVPQLMVNIINLDISRKHINPRSAITLLLWGSFCFYFSWFWWVGLDVLPASGCEDEFGFFFTKVSLRGWFRTFNKVLWTISDIAFVMIISATAIQVLMTYLSREGDDLRVARLTDEEITHNTLQHIFLQGWSFLPFAISVSGAEITLRYNDIRGVNTVNSASQLVPLVLALGLLVHVIGNTLARLAYGFRHAFDEDAASRLDNNNDHDRSLTRTDVGRELREERGWLGVVGRFLFRFCCAFAVGYNQEEVKPAHPNSAGCPKRNHCTEVGIELEGGPRP
ncbi:hypothetical protein F5Y00DRAFT_273435 [Daldinia vernicosa]|uniref:uncharacterized protein n=1 Tax=Daldinia vernicosa TaxID=114800 RepID=UPI002008442F|nr:uncharacterized protein F5Y00DRAFT_273435 [Daldinia vernicosa]KAI0844951.1 hypothetical protein F5Y00DRAFT_273435 [Daldinia vernicosa]